jgi:RNA-directed DNA polymerase
MQSYISIARVLARVFLDGNWTSQELCERYYGLFGRRWRWVRPFVDRLLKHSFGTPRPRHVSVVGFIRSDRGFIKACSKHDLIVSNWLVGKPEMCPVEAATAWQLPAICTPNELADWIGIRRRELDWFADIRLLNYKRYLERLSHYRYRILEKRFGQVRLIESPKTRLKAIQRRILTGILDGIPPHSAAQGFRSGTSICTFAMPHVGQEVVVRLDLRDFFPSISRARIQSLFRTVGYPELVADLLAGICTTATPYEAWKRGGDAETEEMRNARWRYARPHLPQGAPGSPALANLCAYRLDCRLSALADASGAVYTRYADDLAFSGGLRFRRSARRFCVHVAAIAMEEDFAVHYRKTRIMHQSTRQHLAGIVVNETLNIRRQDFDQLKAMLTNCVRFGPHGQNRTGHTDFRRHLEGRIAFVHMVNPVKGKRLMELSRQIRW